VPVISLCVSKATLETGVEVQGIGFAVMLVPQGMAYAMLAGQYADVTQI